MAVNIPERLLKHDANISHTTSQPRRRSAPNPNYKPTTVNMEDLRNRLRMQHLEVLRRVREY